MMALSPALSNVILALTGIVLLKAALTDLQTFKIRNELIVVLVCLFALHALFSGRWTDVHWNLALAVFMFFVMLIFYSLKWMGGGDVKLLTVGFLWAGPDCALVFALLLAGFAVVNVVAAALGLVKFRENNGRKRIAFAPVIAAALIASGLMGCFQPNQYVIKLSQTTPCIVAASEVGSFFPLLWGEGWDEGLLGQV